MADKQLFRKAFDQLTEGDEPGTFEAIANAFDTVDSYGEVVKPGAVKMRGDAKPVLCYQHDWDHPIGVLDEVRDMAPGDPKLPAHLKEKGGIYVKGRFLIGEIDKAKEIYAIVKNGGAQELSIGYYLKSYEVNQEEGVTYLTEIDLVEVSIVLRGANPETALISLKSDQRMTLIEQINTARAAVSAIKNRLSDLAKLRAQEGRTISAQTLEAFELLKSDLADEPVQPPAPDPEPEPKEDFDAEKALALAALARTRKI